MLNLDSSFSQIRPRNVIVLKFENSFPNKRVLDFSKIKAFADEILKTARMKQLSLIVEDVVRKEENAVTSIFFFFFSLTSIFSFSNRVFKRLFCRVVRNPENPDVFGKDIKNRFILNPFSVSSKE